MSRRAGFSPVRIKAAEAAAVAQWLADYTAPPITLLSDPTRCQQLLVFVAELAEIFQPTMRGRPRETLHLPEQAFGWLSLERDYGATLSPALRQSIAAIVSQQPGRRGLVRLVGDRLRRAIAHYTAPNARHDERHIRRLQRREKHERALNAWIEEIERSGQTLVTFTKPPPVF